MVLGVRAIPFTFVAHVLAILGLVFVLVWTLHFRGGLAWEATNKSLIFNVSLIINGWPRYYSSCLLALGIFLDSLSLWIWYWMPLQLAWTVSNFFNHIYIYIYIFFFFFVVTNCLISVTKCTGQLSQVLLIQSLILVTKCTGHHG